MFLILLLLLFVLLISSVGTLLVYKLGNRVGLMDVPNDRSSHSTPTPRSGGIGIWLAFIFVGIFFANNQIFAILAGIMGLLGLLDDRFNFSQKRRLFLQLSFSTAVVGLFLGFPSSLITATLFLFWIIFITGTTNFYNFMDGIDGIAGLTGFVGFGFMAGFSFFLTNKADVALMSIVLAVGCLGFLPFNFPKAKVFMGDVGSIFLGFVFASFVVKLSTNLSIFLCITMFLSMFYADALVTIFYRWRRGENLIKAHRSHLYQYMSNELRLPHWKVSLTYALVQLVFGLIALLAYEEGIIWQIVVLLVFGILFLIAYRMVKKIKPLLIQ